MHQPGVGAREEVRIGVVGAADAVRRVMEVARDVGGGAWKTVATVYADESESYDRAIGILPRIDVCLFTGPLPYDVAMGHGPLPVPATFVPVGGTTLYGTLLRGSVENVLDPLRVSIDSVSPREVHTAYREIGLDVSGVHVQQYVRPESAAEFPAFHRALFESGRTTGAITTVPSVLAALTAAGVPVLRMYPSQTVLRHALETAALLGGGAKLEESRIVTMVVRVPDNALPEPAGLGDYRHQDLELALRKVLLDEARRMDAAVLPFDQRSHLVVTTMGSLRAATDDLTFAPFLERASEELGLRLELGIGLGGSTREAELNARVAVDRVARSEEQALLVAPGETVLRIPGSRRGAPEPVDRTAPGAKALDLLDKIADRLDDDRPEPVVDAVQIAELLGVTLRTARRTLTALADAGLAWPMPPTRTSRVGRPPRPYQLLIEKTGRRSARPAVGRPR